MRLGIRADTISVFSVVFSLAAAVVLILIKNELLAHWWFLGAAVLIQMRLVCNLMDGMVGYRGRKEKRDRRPL